MVFIKKKSSNIYLLHIYAKPNSKRQEILDDGNYLIMCLQSKAIQNKANKELISCLRKKLNISDVKIVSGRKKSNKVIEITFSEDISENEIIKRLFS